MRLERGLMLVAPAVLVSLACGRGPRPLAEVGGRAITLAELSAAVTVQTGRPIGEASTDLQAALFEAFLEEEVVLAASGDPGDRNLPIGQRPSRCRTLMASLCAPPPPPTDAEIDAFLARRGATAALPERIRVRQLVLPDQATASKARERIRQGEDFVSLSREVSRAPNAAQGGAIGWVERGQLPPEFEAATFALADGGVSLPVQSDSGWHVFQVVERRAAGADDGSRNRTRDEVMSLALETARRACLRGLAARVGVRVDCRDVAFPCRNPFEDRT
ncbi:MAG: peptidylprolyl isomerase [Acidobacteria bacterium]|nr:peptidylprolyl isomerase [Acidobacteriota bacterium]